MAATAQPFATSMLDPSLVSARAGGSPNPSSSTDPIEFNPNIYLNNTYDTANDANLGNPSGGVVQPKAGSVIAAAPTMISFDPRAASLSDDDDSDGESSNPRPKKRKSQGNLRSTASTQSLKSAAGDDDDKSRRKISIEYIEDKSKRHITFSKRKAGIMKKAYELSTLTGTQVLLLVVSESGWVYTFTTDKFKPLVKEDENGQLSQGQKLIAACLEAKDSGSPPLPSHPHYQPADEHNSFEANSAAHGGQISLKANPRLQNNRPMATNRRVSSKGRNHIPTAIRIGHDPNVPPVPHLPTPLTAGSNASQGSSYLDQPLSSPISPRNPRSMSHPPQSPAHRNIHQMQQQQQQAMLGAGHPSTHGDYSDMLQRTDMMQMHPYDSNYDPYGSSNPNNMPSGLGYSQDGHHHQATGITHPMSDSAYELYGSGHYAHHSDPYTTRPMYQTRHNSISGPVQTGSYLSEEGYVGR